MAFSVGNATFRRAAGVIHVEPVDIVNKHGTPTDYIVIRTYPGEHAYIDGSLPQFRKPNNADWEPARQFDDNAHEDEYVSTAAFPKGLADRNKVVNRGAFLNRNPYTRLITYSNLNDFRATNETFEKITDYPNPDPRPGPVVMEKCAADDADPACVLYPDGERYRPAKVQVECAADDPEPNCLPGPDGKRYKLVGYRRPWVYMGPGIWFNRDPDSPTAGKVHIRLSHTHNNIDGLADYSEEVDPHHVKLALAPKDMITLRVRNSSYLRFENLSIRYGGEYSIFLTSVKELVFDHVCIWAAGYGVRMGGPPANPTTNTIFRHCQFNGGMPTWYFRSDRKAEYDYDDGGTISLLPSIPTLALTKPSPSSHRPLFLPKQMAVTIIEWALRQGMPIATWGTLMTTKTMTAGLSPTWPNYARASSSSRARASTHLATKRTASRRTRSFARSALTVASAKRTTFA